MSEDFHKSIIQYTFKEAPQVKIPSFVGQQNCERLESNMYESPIKVIQKMMDEIVTEIEEQRDKAVMTKVTETLGFEIDKEELVKALSYDRQQYEKGFKDAKKEFAPIWNPIKTRPLEENEKYPGMDVDWAYDCLLPDDDQEVLVSLSDGKVAEDTFCRDEYDLCYFETYCDKDDVKAWMPKPESYKENE